jgi:DNA polymerase-1
VNDTLRDAPLLIVDGDNLAHRAYHSTPKTVKNEAGESINAIVGFVNILVNVWRGEQPRGVFVAWDTLGVPTYRNELWPDYQGGRVFEPEIVRQLGLLPAVCEAFGFGVGKSVGSEADDLIAAAVVKELKRGGSCLVMTTDKDAYQLVGERVTVLGPQRGGELARIGPAEVEERLGVLPEQVPDFKALAGDSSDKIPGAKGIGGKTAAALLQRHGSLEEVIKAWDRHGEDELVRKFKEMVVLRPKVAVTLPRTGVPDWKGGAAAVRRLGANTLADRLEAM